MWKERVDLKVGETLKQTSSRTKGFMEETDVNEYDILDAEGRKTGSVTHECHTSVRGFRVRHSVVQRDASGVITSS